MCWDASVWVVGRASKTLFEPDIVKQSIQVSELDREHHHLNPERNVQCCKLFYCSLFQGLGYDSKIVGCLPPPSPWLWHVPSFFFSQKRWQQTKHNKCKKKDNFVNLLAISTVCTVLWHSATYCQKFKSCMLLNQMCWPKLRFFMGHQAQMAIKIQTIQQFLHYKNRKFRNVR